MHGFDQWRAGHDTVRQNVETRDTLPMYEITETEWRHVDLRRVFIVTHNHNRICS